MENQHRSGLRELQIAQGLVTLRWIAIPILFAFGILATKFLGMSFPIAPIYILACFLAILNVYFTTHISMLSRQLMLKYGSVSLKKFLFSFVNQSMQELKNKGFVALVQLPRTIFKLMSILYLMVLESVKGVRFNFFSLDNVMHSQIVVDVITLTMFVRYTGSSESPMIVLLVIPVIVAGAVMGFYKGGIYAILTSTAYLIVCLLVNFKIINHMKFYGPEYGDLSASLGWTISSFIMLLVALLGTAYLAHSLTAVFKERIFFLHQLLDKNRRDSIAQSGVAENVGVAWFILDAAGNVVRYKLGRNDLYPNQMQGKNLFEVIPSFKQHGLAYILQSVITSGKPKEIGRVSVQSKEGTMHTVACRLLPITDAEFHSLALLITDDVTEIMFLKERVNELKENLDCTQTELKKTSLDAKEANLHLVKSLKEATDRSAEISRMIARIKEIDEGKTSADNQLHSIMTELAGVKAANDTLAAELKYKQMILEEIVELLKNCNQLDQLCSMIERRSRALFKLDNACLHIFQGTDLNVRLNEILETRKASPRLLDLPRKNPKVIEPVLFEGKPVVFMADVHPEKGAVPVAGTNIRRLVAYIPIRHGPEILGIMMLDRYGAEENTEKFLEMLVYYLSHTAFALKNAISTRDWEVQRGSLGQTIEILEANIGGLINLINSTHHTGEKGFEDFLKTLGKLTGASDAIVLRIHNDGAIQQFARLDPSKGKDLNTFEQQILKTLQGSPTQKATLRDPGDGRIILGYPLNQGNKLCGALLVGLPESRAPETTFLDIIARLAAEHLALFTLQEEKELWESFFQENLKA